MTNRFARLAALLAVVAADGQAWADQEEPLLAQLDRAALSGDVAAVERLLSAGAPATDPSGRVHPLESAALAQSVAVVRILVAHGALRTDGVRALARALDAADREGAGAIAWFLLERGAARGDEGQELVAGAILNDRLPLRAVRFLDLQRPRAAELYRALLWRRGEEGNVAFAEAFLDAGFPFAPAAMNETVLEWFSRQGALNVVQLLVRRGAPVDQGKHQRPLVAALSEAHLDIAAYLLDHGASPRLRDAELRDAVDQLCPTEETLGFLARRLRARLAGPAGARLIENGMTGCELGGETVPLDRVVELGGSPAPLAANGALLYRLERTPGAAAQVAWLRAHGVALGEAERDRLRAEAERERQRSAAREAEAEAREAAAARERRARRAAEARRRFFGDHLLGFAGALAALVLSAAAVTLRERAYPEAAPRWLGTSMAVAALLPGAAVGGVLGSRLGLALLGPGTSSSVYVFPGGDFFGGFFGLVGGAIAGLAAGLVLRHRLRTSRAAYYAVPGTLFAFSVMSLAF